MKKIFFVKKDGYKRTIEEVRTIMGRIEARRNFVASKASDKKKSFIHPMFFPNPTNYRGCPTAILWGQEWRL